MRTAASDAISDFIDTVPVRVHIDGMDVDQSAGLKEESCKTCKFRSGSRCVKHNEPADGWCGNYKFKRA